MAATPESTNGANWKSFLIPAIFGLLASACYWQALASKVKPSKFVQLTSKKSPGDTILPSDLRPIALVGDTKQLAIGLLPWGHRGTAINALTHRRLRAGQLLLKSDIKLEEDVDVLASTERDVLIQIPENVIVDELQVGMKIDFRIQSGGSMHRVGPYRVIQIWNSTSDNRIAAETGKISRIRIAYTPYSDGTLDLELEGVLGLIAEANNNNRRGNKSRVYSIQPHRNSSSRE